MSSYNPNKRVKIEIRAAVNPANDYEVWEAKEGGHCIERNADESDIEYILMPDQYQQFLKGKYTFTVTANVLTNLFSYLY